MEYQHQGFDTHVAWETGKSLEIEFWRKWLDTKGLQWPEDYTRRLDPESPLQDNVTKYLSAPPGSTISILDVGAGPLTNLGKRWKGRTVKIVAVDPLADAYRSLLAEFAITPIVDTQPGEVEHLTDHFPEDYFDLVRIENALDHSYDPQLGIKQMLEVVKPGNYVLLRHRVNEGKKHNYAGLHQWNLCAENGKLVLWNRYTNIDVNDALSAAVDEVIVDRSDREIWAALRKPSL